MSDLISVIIPCYNQAQYLPAALDSVSAQTYSNWQCIIVNDGSPDNSEEIALNYCSKDARFNYIKKENGGLSSARNAGLSAAKGSWIQFLDSDDYVAPEKLELSMDIIAQHRDASLIVSDFEMFTDDHSRSTPAFCKLKQEYLNFESILFDWNGPFNIPIHCGLFKMELFKENLFVDSLKISEDWIMWLNIFKKDIEAYYLDKPLACYRINPGSMTADKSFVRTSMAETFKYILTIIPQAYVYKFACNLIGMYNTMLNSCETELSQLKNNPAYRIPENIKTFSRKLITKKR